MFERYNEAARRMLCFARYESSQLGSLTIETEHLLLGMIREPGEVARRVLELADAGPERVRRDVEARVLRRPKISTSVEIPFSPEVRRVLELAAREADDLRHADIGTEHLLLGMLREDKSPAGTLLIGYGLNIRAARKRVAELVGEGTGDAPVAATPHLSAALARIGELVGSLAKASPGSEESAAMLTEIHVLLGRLKGSLRT